MKVTLSRVNGVWVIASDDLVYCNLKYHSPYLAVLTPAGEMDWQEKVSSGYGKHRSVYYSVQKLQAGDYIQAAGGSGGNKYPFKGRVVSLSDTELEVEKLTDEDFSNIIAERKKNAASAPASQAATARYILNSSVITTPGAYTYRLISVDEAKAWLSLNGWKSTIGYPETADALKQLTGIEIPVDRIQIQMQGGDEALVFRLTKRLTVPESKSSIAVQEIIANCEIGILRKLAAIKHESEVVS